MNVELKVENSTPNPDDAPMMAARGDYMSKSLVGVTADEALLGASDPDKEVWTDEEKHQDFLDQLIRRGHFGPFEHATAFFAVEGVSRVTMAQATRHRFISFDVQSQRYVRFDHKRPVIPESLEAAGMAASLSQHWNDSVALYNEAVERGVPKEDARFFLPQATPVDMTFSANLRTLFHFFDLRHSGKAQWEVRELAALIMDEVREWAPMSMSSYERFTNHNSLRAP
ncbi:thymidylate synthase [Halorubrum tailed virus 25]|uniref:Thymidylate synthase n=1 Tax=Halorubrum tailed virus 25 TaxID=2878006 RepID=A0AAE8XYA1_9CAUD|nr:thymidylate synthase [Halorubrum tailed virus 25]UBF22621.1 thymidylate synthase [Halorubrum tailed virus 25]